MSREYTRRLTILGQLPIAGSVVFSDDFEDTLKWTKIDGIGDSIFELDPTIAKQGSQSLHMKTRTTGAAQNDKIRANHYSHLLPSKIMTFIATFYCPNYLPMDYTQFDFFWYDGTNLNRGRVSYHPATPGWELVDSSRSPIAIPTLAVPLSVNTFHILILKINFTTGKYLSIQVDHLLVDLSTYTLEIDTNNNDSVLQKQIILNTAGATPCEIYLDQISVHEL